MVNVYCWPGGMQPLQAGQASYLCAHVVEGRVVRYGVVQCNKIKTSVVKCGLRPNRIIVIQVGNRSVEP